MYIYIAKVQTLFPFQTWEDSRLSWTPSHHGNINFTTMLHSDVWTPPLVLNNAYVLEALKYLTFVSFFFTKLANNIATTKDKTKKKHLMRIKWRRCNGNDDDYEDVVVNDDDGDDYLFWRLCRPRIYRVIFQPYRQRIQASDKTPTISYNKKAASF